MRRFVVGPVASGAVIANGSGFIYVASFYNTSTTDTIAMGVYDGSGDDSQELLFVNLAAFGIQIATFHPWTLPFNRGVYITSSGTGSGLVTVSGVVGESMAALEAELASELKTSG